MVSLGNGSEAERYLRHALEIGEGLAAGDPANAGFQRDLSIVRQNLARLVTDREGKAGQS
jgi:hypothetical protein